MPSNDLQWNEATLDDLCIKITDGAHQSPPSVEQGLPMASVKDMTSFGINISSARQISIDDFQKLVRQGCQPQIGDVLIAKDGATALDTVCEIKKPLDAVLLSSIAILRPKSDKIFSSYLRYYLDAAPTREYMKAAFTTGAAIPRVVLRDFKRITVFYPPLPIQSRIASILSAYDDLIENNTRRIAILEEMARRIYEEWFVKFKFPGHEKVKMIDSELGRIPEGWAVCSILQIAEVNSRTLRRGSEPKEIIYIDISSVSTSSIDQKQLMLFLEAPGRARRIVQDGDIIWSCVRPNRKSYALVLQPEPNLIVSTGFSVLSATKVPFSYLYFTVTTEDFVSYLTNHATGAAYPAVTAKDFEAAKLLKPSTGLLNDFHCSIEPMLRLGNLFRLKNANLRATRDFLLPKLISGEIDVAKLPEPEEAAA